MSNIPCPQAARAPGIATLALPPISNIVTDAPVVPVSNIVAQDLPNALVDQSITWPYHLPTWNGVDCLWWAMLARSMYAPDQTWLARVAGWAGPVRRIQFVGRSSPSVQGYGLVELNDSVLIVIPGTSSEAEALSYFLSHSLRLLTTTPGHWQMNSTWATRGAQVLAGYQAWPPPSPAKPIIIIGHSSGGAYGAYVAYSVFSSPTNPVTLITCGAPIWGTASLINTYNDQGQLPKTIDLTLPADPVPLLPPTWALIDILMPSAYALAARPNYFRLNNQLQLSGNGPPQVVTQPSTVYAISAAALTLLTGGDPGAPHATASYTAAADTWALNDPSIASLGLTPARRSLEAILVDMNSAGLY